MEVVFNGAKFLFRMRKNFWKLIAVTAAQHCECTQCHHTPKNGQHGKTVVISILPQFSKKSRSFSLQV